MYYHRNVRQHVDEQYPNLVIDIDIRRNQPPTTEAKERIRNVIRAEIEEADFSTKIRIKKMHQK